MSSSALFSTKQFWRNDLWLKWNIGNSFLGDFTNNLWDADTSGALANCFLEEWPIDGSMASLRPFLYFRINVVQRSKVLHVRKQGSGSMLPQTLNRKLVFTSLGLTVSPSSTPCFFKYISSCSSTRQLMFHHISQHNKNVWCKIVAIKLYSQRS